MSALLPLSANEINVCAEYGYSNRSFDKRPWVVIADDYKSALFLVYRQTRILPNRIPRYRNHFTLFSDGKTVVVVRTETTLVHRDNDAVLTYDCIRPNDSETDRFRAKSGDWTMSFDRISYSNQRPVTFVGYELQCSGEWWFYDRGVILNGVTRYVRDSVCESMFIYYELHPMYRVTRKPIEPSPPKLVVLPPTTTTTTTSTNVQQEFSYTKTTAVSKDREEAVATTATNLSSVPTGIIPLIEGSARSVVTKNDTIRTPDVTYQAVVPSVYWFNARTNELKRGDIAYFLPLDYLCASV